MDEQLKELIKGLAERIERLEAQLQAVLAAGHVVAPEGSPASVSLPPAGAPSLLTEPDEPQEVLAVKLPSWTMGGKQKVVQPSVPVATAPPLPLAEQAPIIPQQQPTQPVPKTTTTWTMGGKQDVPPPPFRPGLGMERVGDTWRPVGTFESPEEVQQAARRFAGQVTPAQLQAAQQVQPAQPQPLPQPPPFVPPAVELPVTPQPSIRPAPQLQEPPQPAIPRVSQGAFGTAGTAADELAQQPLWTPQQRVQQNAIERAEERQARMRARGQIPHIDRIPEAFRHADTGPAAQPEPARLPPVPGTVAHQQQTGGFAAIADFAQASVSSLSMMVSRITLAMQQIEELRRDLEMKGHD